MMILKKGAQVKIITGKDKGKTGEILEINRKLNKVKIKSINIKVGDKVSEGDVILILENNTEIKEKNKEDLKTTEEPKKTETKKTVSKK